MDIITYQNFKDISVVIQFRIYKLILYANENLKYLLDIGFMTQSQTTNTANLILSDPIGRELLLFPFPK